MLGLQELRELLGDAVLFAPLQRQQDMFLGWEVKEEGSVGDPCCRHNGADVGLGHAGPLELRDGGAHQSLPRLQALCFTRRYLSAKAI